MSTVNGNNCAFPLFDSNGDYTEFGEENTLGLTKREYFACEFLTSMVSSSKFLSSIEGRLDTSRYDLHSKQALALADSLLEALDL